MCRHADVVELGKYQLGNSGVEQAFAVDDRLFLIVESRLIVLLLDNQSSGLGTFVKDLGLALVDTGAALVHVFHPSSKPRSTARTVQGPGGDKDGISRRFQFALSPLA